MRARLQRLGAPDVVLPEGVAAVDDDVAGVDQCRRGLRSPLRSARRRAASTRSHAACAARRPTPPGPSRRVAPACTSAAIALGVAVVDDRFVPVLHQAPGDVATHAPEPDYADLHGAPLQAAARARAPLFSRNASRTLSLDSVKRRTPSSVSLSVTASSEIAGARRDRRGYGSPHPRPPRECRRVSCHGRGRRQAWRAASC